VRAAGTLVAGAGLGQGRDGEETLADEEEHGGFGLRVAGCTRRRTSTRGQAGSGCAS
jgi:hypothetical protein